MKRSTRRRVARFVAVAGIAVVGVYLFQSFPREVSIRFALGPDHDVVTRARIAYLDDESGEPVKGFRLDYPEGAPKTFRHQVDLPPGRYDVRAELRGPSLSRTITRSLEVPADGLVHMDLFNQAYARNLDGPSAPNAFESNREAQRRGARTGRQFSYSLSSFPPRLPASLFNFQRVGSG